MGHYSLSAVQTKKSRPAVISYTESIKTGRDKIYISGKGLSRLIYNSGFARILLAISIIESYYRKK